MATELLFLRDAEMKAFEATVTAVDPDGRRLALDRTAFYPTGGGQPHDTGRLGGLAVVGVAKEGDEVWHLVGEGPWPEVGAVVAGTLDWDRRHALMRTHTALHVLCGVIWNAWGVPVTGGNMEPLSARMDFAFDPLPEGFGARVEEQVNAELGADRPIEVSFLSRDVAVEDEDLIRTKASLIPESVAEIRVVDIVGLDKQADGGTHVRSTAVGEGPRGQDRVQGEGQQADPHRDHGLTGAAVSPTLPRSGSRCGGRSAVTLPTLRRCGSRRSCRTIRRMATLTIRTDVEVEQALESLTRDGRSRSEATRAAILDAERAHRRNRLRAEAEELRRDPDDVAASRELAARMEAIRAW